MEFTLNFSTEEKRALVAHGADKSIWNDRHDFDLHSQLIPFKPKIPAVKLTNWSTTKQYDKLTKRLEKPISRHPLIVVSSYPTDSKSKLVGLNLLNNAIAQFKDMSVKQRKGKSRPVWHKLYGGYRDRLLDGDLGKPSFIIISNVTDRCSNQKLEKLRDILEKYNDVPRVVIMGSEVDPVTFLGRALYMSIKEAYYIASENVVINKLTDLF